MTDAIAGERAAQPPAAPAWLAEDQGHPHRWAILFTILAIEIMDVVDSTIVNVAAPEIAADLSASPAALQWIVGGYALTFAVGLITGGRLGDIYGRRQMFMLGIAAFTVTSLLCGLAPSPGTLIAARLLQGLGAALMIPQGFGMVRQTFSNKELAKAFSFWGPMVSIGALLGPIIGGLIIELDAWSTDWRGIFLVNIPIGIVALLSARFIVPDYPRSDWGGSGLDLKGAAVVALAAGLIVYPLIEGRERDWPISMFVIGAAGIAMLIAFGFYERHRERTGAPTLFVTSIFRNAEFLSAVAIVAIFFSALTGLLLVTTLYLQIDQGFSPIDAGLALIPWATGAGLGAASTNWLRPLIGRHVLHLGLATVIGAMVLLLVVLSADGHDISWGQLAGPLFAGGIGLGLTAAPLFTFALAGAKPTELGSASGVINTMQYFGTAAGVAALGTVFFAVADDSDMLAGFETCIVAAIVVFAFTALLVLRLPVRPQSYGD